MKSTFATTVASVAALAGSAYAQSNLPIINTPAAVVQCQPALISFSGGTAPYFLSVLPGGQAGATPIELLPDQPAAGSFTWTVNVPAGTSITLQVRDGAGQLNYASQVTVQNSNDASCLGQAASGSIIAGGSTVAATATAGTGGAATTAMGTSGAMSTGASTTLTSTAAMSTVTAGSGVPTTNVSTTNGTTVDPESYNFTCSQGELSYAITVAELDIPLREATAFFSNWTGAVPGTLVNSTGSGVNATRTYTLATATLEEELLVQQTNRTTGSLHQQWNLTAPVQVAPNVTVYTAFQDLTVYTNETTNNTNAQWFILACPNSQAAGLPALTAFVDAGIAGFQSKIAGGNSTTGPAAATTAAAAPSAPARNRVRWL